MIIELERKKVDRSVCRLINSYLTDRQVKITYAGTEVMQQTNKGCIQGSTCGPLLWNLLLDPLLREIEDLGTHIQAYADDILVIAKGKTAKDLEYELNTALDHILAWTKTRKMKLEPQKTQAIFLTRKLKYDTPKLFLDNTTIMFSESITILGLTIDANLNFIKHIDTATEKATQLYKKNSRAARANWSLNPEILRTIYITVVEPTVLYAAGAWGSTASKQIKVRLDRITRIFTIMISKAHRTASLVSCTTLARILPLDLRARENAEIYSIKRGKPIAHLPGRKLAKHISPYTLPHPADKISRQYGMITSETDINAIENNWPYLARNLYHIRYRTGHEEVLPKRDPAICNSKEE
ncbi:unnamed protein product [Parnassius mnemosyne]|uniref:Reverse transcriptase domain-containing protein n=1 Tax=Parnassius mnemosyne TaxID=213953 RepID=A0AAV1LKJ2_9NEOP